MTDTRTRLLYPLTLLALLVLAAYGNTLTHGFVWDDFDIIVNNPLLDSLRNIPAFFLSEDKVASATGYYRPLTYVSFALDRALWGLNPLGFNITNLLLAVLVVLFFYLVILELFDRPRLALVASIILALHPLGVETVNFHAGGRNTLLAACFTLLALYLYLKERPAASVLCFTLAIFSKEFALLLPAVLLYHDRVLKGEKFRLPRYLPYLAATAGYLVLRSLAVQQANFLASARVSQQLLLTPYLAARYLVNMLYPFDLRVLYDERISITLCLASLVLILVLVAALYFLRRRRELAFGDFWFLLFLLPVVNLIPIHSNTLMADRYAYFSLMGVSLALASLIDRLRSPLRTGVIIVLAALFLVLDLRHNGTWAIEVTLYTRMGQDAPQMSIGPRNLALYYYRIGALDKALPLLESAAAKPDIEPQALVGAASIMLEAQRPAQAEALLVRSLALDAKNPEAYVLLEGIERQKGGARSYLDQGRRAIAGFDAERKLEAAVFVTEGERFLAARKVPNARNILERALALDPANPDARRLLARLTANLPASRAGDPP